MNQMTKSSGTGTVKTTSGEKKRRKNKRYFCFCFHYSSHFLHHEITSSFHGLCAPTATVMTPNRKTQEVRGLEELPAA